MSQDLATELRTLAQRASASLGASRARATLDFWYAARQFRAALPPLLLPIRSGSTVRRIGYLAAKPGCVTENSAKFSVGADDTQKEIWLYLLNGVTVPSPPGLVKTVALTNLSELQAARLVAEADLDLLIDCDGAALAVMPLLIALHPARALVEPLFEPACATGPGSQPATSDSITEAAHTSRLDRPVVNGVPDSLRQELDSPSTLNGAIEQAIPMHRAGELGAARNAYESVLARYPEHPVAAYMLGQLSHQQGRITEAISWLQRAVKAAPEFRDAHYTLGQRLADLGRWAEAASAYRCAVDLTPGFAAGWSGLGLAAQHETGAAARAGVECLERAVALEPDSVQWRFNLGAALQRAGNLTEARQAYAQTLARSPGHVEALFNLGAAAQEQFDYAAAIAAYRAALQQQPGFEAAYPQLGTCLQLTGQIESWLENFRRYRESCRESLPMATYGLEASMAAGDPAAHADWRDRILVGQFLAADPETFTRNWEQLLFLLLHVDLDREILYQWYRRYDAAATAWYGAPAGWHRLRRPGRTRIGYLSGDLRAHVMGRMIHGWVRGHDRDRYDITLYSLSAVGDAWTERFQALGVPMVDLWSLSHAAAAERIRQDDIDLLIDCSGHTRGAQPGILALKPARIVATHIATPGPVGLHAIDFKLTETLAESEDAQQFVIERLLPVPEGVFPWRRYPVPGVMQRSSLGLVTDTFVCGVFVSLMKLSPRCLGLWRRVLERVPTAMLAFSPAQASWRPAYLAWLQAHGISPDRVTFIPCPADEAGQLARYRLLDVALDPMPCGNVNGTMEALAMGVPVVTLVGPRHGERLGNALLTRFGLTETIALDEDEYIRIVARLASDQNWAAQVRGLIAQRLVDSPVWNTDAHVRGLEAAFERMLTERGVTAETNES